MNVPAFQAPPEPRQRLTFRWAIVGLAVLLPLTGCSLVKTTAAIPQRTLAVFVPGGKSNQPDPGDLQQSLMRFADDYSAQTERTIDQLARTPDSPLTPSAALGFKLASVAGAMAIAAGQNPYANLVDMVSMVTLTRMVLQNYWVKTTNGAAYESWFQTSLRLETNIWQIADQVLKPDQQAELRRSIEEWYAANPDIGPTFLVRPHEVALALPRTLARRKSGSSVFNVVQLDPFTSLDPAVREITETRLFAERAMYSIQRMPLLLRWQSELLLYEVGSQPKVAQALSDTTRLSESVDRISRAAESLSRTAEKLPDQFAAERQAILSALDEQSGKLTALSEAIRRTLTAGEQMSTSLNTTLTTFDGLMKRFGIGEPDTTPPDTNSPPFNILDYATTADRVAAMAAELNVVIKDLNTTLDSPALDARLKAVDQVSSRAAADARGLTNHAFLLAAALVVFIFVCAGIYRATRRQTAHRDESA